MAHCVPCPDPLPDALHVSTTISEGYVCLVRSDVPVGLDGISVMSKLAQAVAIAQP